ncbi:RNA m5u methyltransferase, putative [Ichthyophthirius multifiliis]|uniref:RNA m5u methyltransferase, putative n=1 Tax=Ichthyophthirius multifiliis TaxID=5932 RepID=G0R5J7_ICHMU|nr:RNA m5u methyltransferase, putative [Ichthyophthirius multifiliis]EGR27257.1 RNA m5u methyltransferase, putative [Ichthyophthirius multifiliis]|eukprot:XP_004024141.1 RNA m5u methyltransferase, putative [Ichthyophthirius multifiliis]
MKRKLPDTFPQDPTQLKNEEIQQQQENQDNEENLEESQINSGKNAQYDPEWVCLRGVDHYDRERKIYNNLNRNLEQEIFNKIEKIGKPKIRTWPFQNLQTNKKLKNSENMSKKVNQVKNLNSQNTIQEIPLEAEIEEELKIPLEEKICPLALAQLNKDNDIQKIPKWVTRKPEEEKIIFIECTENFFNYRNKSEFTIGKNHKDEIRVGFNRTNFNKKIAFIDDAQKNCLSTLEQIKIAEILQEYIIQNQSNFQVYDRFTHKGFWRYLVVRQSFQTFQILINIVVKYEKEFSDDSKEKLKNELIPLFTQKNQFEPYNIVSLNIQNYEDPSDSIPHNGKIENIYGNPNYDEIILGNTFKISPNAFLQVHTKQCQKLYNLIGNIIQKIGISDQNTIFLDICSGIGTIGICLAQKAKQIIGIECVETACQDCEENIKINNVQNYKVVQGKVEDVIQNVVQPLINQNFQIIGVVDPPRAGLNQSVVKALRTSPAFHTVEYFACDLFPQTKHFEGIFYLQRYPIEE